MRIIPNSTLPSFGLNTKPVLSAHLFTAIQPKPVLTQDLVQFSSLPPSKKERRHQVIEDFLNTLDINISQLSPDSSSHAEALELLDRAFTHMSVKKNNNYEYLEFLGDGILSGVIREYFFHKLPRGNEQQYLKSHYTLFQVCSSNAFLAIIAKDLGITRPDLLLINHDEMRRHAQMSTSNKDELTQGKPKLSPQDWENKWQAKYRERRQRAPADCMEGLIGALHIIDPTQNSIKKIMVPYLDIMMSQVTPKQLETGTLNREALFGQFEKLMQVPANQKAAFKNRTHSSS